MSGSKVCLVLDRRERGSDQVILGLNWFKRLSAKYPGKLQVVLPDYLTIFAGTILEEILDTTSDMASGVIWALLWKVLERDSSDFATLKSKKPTTILASQRERVHFEDSTLFGYGTIPTKHELIKVIGIVLMRTLSWYG